MNKATNSTVLGVASLKTTLPLIGAALVVLFVVMKPEATQGYDFVQRVAFWTTHVALGLVSIILASKLFRPRLLNAMPMWGAVVLTGLTGTAFLAPAYLLIESLTPVELIAEPDDWLDEFAARGLLQAIIAEFLEVVPMFLSAWVLVNLPLLLSQAGTNAGPTNDPGGSAESSPEEARNRESNDPGDAEAGFVSQLPRAIGADVILVSSDLHYLHVYTTQGKCMVLGTLRDVAQAFGSSGMLVHRSHWVAHAHVQRLAQKKGAVECVLTNNLRVPVSRRNRSKVTEWYGKTGNVLSMAAAKRPDSTAAR